MKEIKAIIEPSRIYSVVAALRGIPAMPSFTLADIRAFPPGGSGPPGGGSSAESITSVEMFEIECVIPDPLVPSVVDAIKRVDGGRRSERERIVVHAVEEPAARESPAAFKTLRH